MKLKTFWYLAVLLCLAHTLALAGSINDTVWTKRFKDGIGNMSFTSDGNQLMIPTGDSLFLLDSKTGSVLKSYEWGIGYYHHFINNEKNCIYFSNTDSSFHIRDLSNGVELRKIYCPESSYFSTCSYTPDAKYAIITTNLPFNSGVDNFIPVGLTWKVIDLETGEIKQQKSYPLKPKFAGVDVQKVFLSATGDTAIVQINRSYGDGAGHWTYWLGIVGYDVRSGDSLFIFPDYGNIFQSDDCSMFALLTTKVDIISLKTQQLIQQVNTAINNITDVEFAKDNSKLGLCRVISNKNLEIWSIPENNLLYNNKLGYSHIKFSPIINQFASSAAYNLFLYNWGFSTEIQNFDLQKKYIYPNPSQGTIKFSIPNNFNILNYSIINIKGVVCKSGTLDAQNSFGEYLLFVDDLEDGSYILEVNSKSTPISYHFTITK